MCATGRHDQRHTSGPPLRHFDNIPVPVRADDPTRWALLKLQQLLDAGRWADADLVGWL